MLGCAGLWLIRMILDPMLVRRPMLNPNVTVGGLAFLGISLFIVVGHIIAQSVIPERPNLSVLTVAVYIIAALTLSEVAKLASQIWYYRAGI